MFQQISNSTWLKGTLLTVTGCVLAFGALANEAAKTGVVNNCSNADFQQVSSNLYEVYRNDKKIGDHRIDFAKSGDHYQIQAITKMRVKLLFITAFRYDYRSVETWCDGQLFSVTTNVDDDGKITKTKAVLGETGYQVSVDETSSVITQSIMTTNHWNDGAMQQSALFNTITGKLNSIDINQLQRSDLREYDMQGDLNITTRYDQLGNWQGMIFKHTDGSTIEFRCVSCNNTPENLL